jgi:hypothetical protein
MEDTASIHRAQQKPSHSQDETSESEKLTTNPLDQKKTLFKMSSRPKKPPITRSDDFLW